MTYRLRIFRKGNMYGFQAKSNDAAQIATIKNHQ